MAQTDMLLLAESGATKTEWRCLQDRKVIRAFQSGGFNPNTQSPAVLDEKLASALQQGLGQLIPTQIRFYGAGLGNPPQRKQLHASLQALFPLAEVKVYHDLQAAVHSTGLQDGMLGILGTGSNACLFQAGTIVQKRGGLGYLLGDEGSGTDLARILVKTLIEGGFNVELSAQMWKVLGTDKGGIIHGIYGADRPHAYLSNLMPQLAPFVENPSVRSLIINRFLAFLDATFCQWPEHKALPLCMVGAIAFHFQELFEEACQMREIWLEKVDPSPIEGLVDYYLGD